VISLEKPWEKPFKTREETRKALSPMGLIGHVCSWLGVAFAALGVIGDAVNITLGLEPVSWLLLAIVAGLTGMPSWLTWAVALHLLGIEGESKKEE